MFRFTLKHSFIILMFLSLLILGQAYWFTWIIPQTAPVNPLNALPLKAGLPGYMWLVFTAIIVAVFITMLKLTGKNISPKNKL